VYVPEANVLGQVDHGFRVAMQTLDLFRPSVGAFALGMAEAALRLATGHATTRTAFGTPIADFQGVSHQLADVRLDIEAAELLVYSAAAAHDDGDTQSLTGKAAMAKLHATESAQHVIDDAVQLLGARGVRKGSIVERLYREIRALRIYEGTSEIQKIVIAGTLTKPT
jgi:alkylation response protein AidB-like acyl-CoA dehydrogenase